MLGAVASSLAGAGAALAERGSLLMIKLSGVTVGSYQLAVAETDPLVTDRFTLAFSSISITKRRQNSDGSLGQANPVTIPFPPPAP